MNIAGSKPTKGKTMSRQSEKMRNGFTLIEVMIALAVLTIGLTGLAAMQLSSMQYAHSSHFRSLATTIAMDFEERLWLELADNTTLLLCDGSTIASAATALATHWNRSAVGGDWDWSTANMLKVPNLTITPGAAVTSVPSVVLIPVTLTWGENRFEDTEDLFDDDEIPTESFDYNVRIQCRAA